MKKSDIQIGKVYAFSRDTNPTSVYHISGFIVDSLEPVKDWRGRLKNQEVHGRFTDKDGNPKPESSTTSANIRRLIGDYLPVKHDLEIRDKNREIAQLNKQIASTQIEGLIKSHTDLITGRIDIKSYDIRNHYDGRATITLDANQFQKLVWAFQGLNRYEAQARLDEQARIQKAYEESQETVNA